MDQSPVLPFVILLACGTTVAAAAGLQMVIGFIVGVLVTLAAAAIVCSNSEDIL